MKKVFFLIWSLCVSLATFGQPNELQIVTGKIIDTKGQPISNAKVVLYYNHSRWGMGNRIAEQTESGKDGLFAFKSPLNYSNAKEYPYGRDSYLLLASHPEYAFGWKKIDRNQKQAGYEITLTEPKSQMITVTDHDGKPLHGALVWPYSAGSPADPEPLFRDYLSLPTYVGIVGGITGADGKATINNLPKTRCSFYAKLQGYAKGLSFRGDRPIRLSKGATVAGIISDEDGNPVQGALVKFHTEWTWNFFLTRTDYQGRFRMEDLPAEGWDMSPSGKSVGANGIYVITIEHSDYITSETQDQFKSGELVKDFVIEAYRGTLIKCHVVDVKSNLPIAGARIYGSNESGRIDKHTDADGVLTVRVMPGRTSLFFGSPPEGVYVLRDQDPPESNLRFDAKGKQMTVTLKSPPIAGRLTSVKGKVQLPDGTPAADLKISTTNSAPYRTSTFSGTGGTRTSTNSDGSFELKDVPVGLKLFLYGNTTNCQYILAEVIENVEDPTILSDPLVMQQGQATEALLTDIRGQSCANLSVKIKPTMWGDHLFYANFRSGEVDAQGRLKINGIIPGLEYFIIDSRADLSESGWWDRYYNQTMTLIPLKRMITSFAGIDIEFDMDQAKDKIMLVCFFDMNQRPSRHCISRLTSEAKQLKDNNITLVAVQASKIEKSALRVWVKKNDVPFPVGRIVDEDEEKVRLCWGVKSLPWLTLTDRRHLVVDTGFGLSELDDKINTLD